MAKKKADAPEEMNYSDVHSKKVEDLIGTPKPEETRAEEIVEAAAEPEKPAETPKEEPKETPIEFDPKKFEDEMIEKMGKVSKETAKEVVEAVTHKEEPKEEVVEELKSPWEKEGREPKSYAEIADWAVEKKSILDKRESDRVAKETAKAEKAAEDQRLKQTQDYNKYFDSEMEELYAAGKLPKPADLNNPEDEGTKARIELVKKMAEVNTERQKAGKPLVYSPRIIFYENYTPPVKEVAGGDAPVSPGKGDAGKEGKEVNYNDVHRKSILDIFLGK